MCQRKGHEVQTELLTISRIFTESLYRIPDYQRGYSWGINQLRDFWLDIEQLQGDAKHYTGVLTLEDVPEEKWAKWEDDLWIIQARHYKPYYVVDGQQRLTTVIILIQCILENFLENSKSDRLNYTPLGDIKRKYVFDSKMEDSARSYLFGYEKDNPSYEFLKKRIFLESSDVHLPDEATIYTKNLLAAKDFFRQQLAKIDVQGLEELFTKVTQQLVFNVYEIASDIDVFVTFETMNNRGKPLSTLELLKNRLIYLSTKLPAPAGREHILRRKVNDAWKAAYHYLGKNDARPLNDDDFLRTQLWHFSITKLALLKDKTAEGDRDRPLRQFVRDMEEYSRYLLNELFTPKRIGAKTKKSGGLPPLTREFIDDYSQHLKNSVELYYKLSTPSESDFSSREKIELERIGRLVGFSPSPLLMSIYQQEAKADARIRCLEQMERYYFCRSIGAHNPYFLRHRYEVPEYIQFFTTGKYTLEELTTFFENHSNEMFKEVPVADLLADWVKNGGGYYGWRSIKYFLYEYELSLQQSTRSSRTKIDWDEFSKENFQDDYETVEHIYPQRAKDPYWAERFSKFNPSQKRLLRNSLGNLLALSRPRNSSLGNRSFVEKLGDDTAKTGYRYGSYSENEVGSLREWDAEQIVRRGLQLLTFLEKRWKLPIGDRQAKKRALGLGFIPD